MSRSARPDPVCIRIASRLFRDQFRNTFDFRLSAGFRYACSYGLCHSLDVSIGGVVENEHLSRGEPEFISAGKTE